MQDTNTSTKMVVGVPIRRDVHRMSTIKTIFVTVGKLRCSVVHLVLCSVDLFCSVKVVYLTYSKRVSLVNRVVCLCVGLVCDNAIRVARVRSLAILVQPTETTISKNPTAVAIEVDMRNSTTSFSVFEADTSLTGSR